VQDVVETWTRTYSLFSGDILGAVALCTAGIVWMVSTLIAVDKRTEVINVKLDHLVEAVDELTTRKARYDRPWTDAFPNIQAAREVN
jgi:hypothetical protein